MICLYCHFQAGRCSLQSKSGEVGEGGRRGKEGEGGGRRGKEGEESETGRGGGQEEGKDEGWERERGRKGGGGIWICISKVKAIKPDLAHMYIVYMYILCT